MSNKRFENVETHLAHISKTCDELSDVVASQQKQIDKLKRIVLRLAEREKDTAEPDNGNPDKVSPIGNDLEINEIKNAQAKSIAK